MPPVQFAYIVTLWPGVTELADACNEDDSEEDDIVVVIDVVVKVVGVVMLIVVGTVDPVYVHPYWALICPFAIIVHVMLRLVVV